MKHLSILLLSIIVAISLLLGCSNAGNDVVNTDDNSTFCSFVEKGEFDSTKTEINNFLATIDNTFSDSAKIEKLKIWLERKDCISDVEVICISGIYTLPAQSELAISFISNGESVNLIMDISMSEPLKFSGYHGEYGNYPNLGDHQ